MDSKCNLFVRIVALSSYLVTTSDSHLRVASGSLESRPRDLSLGRILRVCSCGLLLKKGAWSWRAPWWRSHVCEYLSSSHIRVPYLIWSVVFIIYIQGAVFGPRKDPVESCVLGDANGPLGPQPQPKARPGR
ncbi:hypothetical protein BJX68DRAFT_238886 [Aspergillus pseudodeflectus]|uniref:Uncharacterized protein n=1 Tax=Aspergillus pseudodeflectus TaxID=176178 RepID=A0ABR4K7N1_9EURO